MSNFNIPSAAEFCAKLLSTQNETAQLNAKCMTEQIMQERSDIAYAFKSHMLFWEKKVVQTESVESQPSKFFNFFKQPKPDKTCSRLSVTVQLLDEMSSETERYLRSLNYKIDFHRASWVTEEWEYFITPKLKQ
jgi:hypothetical protein